MQKRRLAALFLAIAITIVLPSVALAASGSGLGLVPCGVTLPGTVTDPNVATECQGCNLIQLAQNIITFMIGIAVPIAMAMFAYAGFLYYTSGVGGTENISKARKIFSSSAMGFALALVSWLIVNTILTQVVSKDEFPNSNWFRIDCTVDRITNKDIGSVITSHLGLAPTVTPVATPAIAPSCASFGPDYSLQSVGSSQLCVNSAGSVKNPTYISTAPSGSAQGSSEYAALLANVCSQRQSSGTQCTIVQAISINESSGGQNCPTSATGAVGCMQVLATTACSINSSISGCGECIQSGNSTSAECAPVRQAIADPTLNADLGVQYIDQLSTMPALTSLRNQYGTCAVTAASYFQGPGSVLNYGGIPPVAASYVNKACN